MHLWSWGHDYLGQPALEKHVVFIFWNTFHVCRGNLKAHFTIRLDCIGPCANTPTPASECGPREVQLGKTRKQSLPTGNNPAQAVPEKQRAGCRGPSPQTTGSTHCSVPLNTAVWASLTVLGAEQRGHSQANEGNHLRLSYQSLSEAFDQVPSYHDVEIHVSSCIPQLLAFSDCWSHSKQNKAHAITQDLW